ncbi:1,4-dihydroxy-2-naphthoate polyprenyltransferase [Photobacterium sp. GJ3]|uniref:1,4-dihydroxy-2-naphthoate polyprenyltransferase n=1 Tax=Photobacterium sp. GJ3 TaxID=2829502 RepID=UPI001B8B433D|nr:1,4-dihydroxy-2-naphthoate polyprenyltransferase [Photobacterium sp. GJ3]QUJ67258.1 1,4-dihydroxy-2-naphthoate polyprenyltransferase [Photobacterium sp. GJ3]
MLLSPSTVWLEATRPKTLLLAIAALLCGNALAVSQGHFSPSVATLALVTALLLQILSNLANDYGDVKKGTDNANRLGPIRGLQSGAISLSAMRMAMAVTLLLIILSGLALLILAKPATTVLLIFVGLGAAAIIAALAYTLGKRPYGYRGLGDPAVLIFFGWVAVGGSYYLQSHLFSLEILLPATASGLLAVGVLNLNNLRDMDNDRACGKITLAARLGPRLGRGYHLGLLAASVLCFAAYNVISALPSWGWLYLLAIPLLVQHGIQVWVTTEGQALRPMLGQLIRAAMFTNLLYAVGLILSR